MIAEGLRLARRERAGKPLHIVLHEYLHGRAADGNGALDGHRTAAGGGDVGAEERKLGLGHGRRKTILHE
jgi:hypothetical protein